MNIPHEYRFMVYMISIISIIFISIITCFYSLCYTIYCWNNKDKIKKYQKVCNTIDIDTVGESGIV